MAADPAVTGPVADSPLTLPAGGDTFVFGDGSAVVSPDASGQNVFGSSRTYPPTQAGSFDVVSAQGGTFFLSGSGEEKQSPSSESADPAQQTMARDVDIILARIESGISAERSAMDALLHRVTSSAA